MNSKSHVYSLMIMIACPRCGSNTNTSPCAVCRGSFDQKGFQTPQAATAKAETKRLVRSTAPEEYSNQLVGLKSLGGYQFQTHLATGGMGYTWLGYRSSDQKKVVIKAPRWSDSDSQLRFTREAQALTTCQHHHIVRLIDIDMTTDHQPLLILEYIPGNNLRDFFSKRPLTVAEFEGLSFQLAGAIDHCHRRGIIHRDLKPENIMYNDNKITLIDFSLALVDQYKAKVISHATPNGFILGTPPYSAPEQLRSPSEVDSSADLYSLGILLEECLYNTDLKDFDHTRLKQWTRLIKQCCNYNQFKRPNIGMVIQFCNLVTIQNKIRLEKSTVVKKNNKLYLFIIALCIITFYSLFTFLNINKDQISLQGSINPNTVDELIINHKNWNKFLIKTNGSTKVRLPGSGNWSNELHVSNYNSNTLPIRITDSDGEWSIVICKED